MISAVKQANGQTTIESSEERDIFVGFAVRAGYRWTRKEHTE
jgi:hypothetical protein